MRILLIAISFLFLSIPAVAKDMVVRVLLDDRLSTFHFSTLYPLQIKTNTGEIVRFELGKSQHTIKAVGGEWHLRTVAHGKVSERALTGGPLKISAQKINWNQQKIDFPLELTLSKKKLILTGSMSMNRYLNGVLPHEMPAAWPVEALKVQAVASRTYAMWKIKNASSPYFDLRPSVSDQVFKMDKDHSVDGTHPHVARALAETEGMYLTSQGNKAFKAYFHSDCGGVTEQAGTVWGGSPTSTATASVRDVACENRASVWKSRWSLESFQQKLARAYVLPENLQLMDVIVRSKSQSQRADSVDLIFDRGFLKRISGEDVRRVLGYDKVKSTLFAVQRVGDELTFTGRGYGHGVGMCQWGTRSMAMAGRDFKDILKHYYPNSKLMIPEPDGTRFESTTVSSL